MMNERIKIYKQEEKIEKGRRREPSPILFYECWAEIKNLYGQELYGAMNNKLENTIVFKVRYCPELEELINKEKFIIYWRNRKFKIYYPDFMNFRKDFIKIKCNEVL